MKEPILNYAQKTMLLEHGGNRIPDDHLREGLELIARRYPEGVGESAKEILDAFRSIRAIALIESVSESLGIYLCCQNYDIVCGMEIVWNRKYYGKACPECYDRTGSLTEYLRSPLDTRKTRKPVEPKDFDRTEAMEDIMNRAMESRWV